MSFTQYAASGLFCWVDNNFQTAKMLESMDPEGKKQADEWAVDWWQHGLQLFQTFESLLARIELSNLN